jgi:hypothetical protein
MHTLKDRHFPKATKIAMIIGAVVLLGGGAAALYYFNTTKKPASQTSPSTSNQPINNEAPTTTQKQAGDQQKQTIINNDETNKAPATSPLDVSFTAASQSGSTVSIRGLIANAITNSGNCTLTITNGSSSVTKTSSTQALANSSTCKGFDVPSNSLPAGTWQLHLQVTDGSRSGSAEKSIVVN